ncbi:helicase POLQ-like [Battus philenor]|uniref:helicase POLQ-like n=1 Tax=Battus philenor TaxID=42288 RepID=UPI0035D01980
MNFQIDNNVHCKTTSTPKRRRLGTQIVVRGTNNKNTVTNCKSPEIKHFSENIVTLDGWDSPPLPCNQVEYLSDSGNNTNDDIHCDPDVMESCFIADAETSKLQMECENIQSSHVEKEINEISDDMFLSRLEQKSTQSDEVILTSRCEQHFIEEINDGFEAINQSIIAIKDGDNLFETKDSFLLEVDDVLSQPKPHHCKTDHGMKSEVRSELKVPKDHFYQLPMITKGLFKTYRKIEKLYDWQEECLSLDAINERRNLIYALPTSGGKTLVAEILMLREVINRKRNALFILPFVAIVQEKIWSLSPFALQLNFLVEEYAAGKGHIPPKKRRTKNSIYIATIEKGLALVRSLIELDRLHEIGLIVVDELHLIGEEGRGGTLETLLSTVLFVNKTIQIVGMSATIGNINDIAKFLQADVYQRQFRPVELTEYVKLGDVLHRIVWGDNTMEVIPDRQLKYDYTEAATNLDPDRLGGLVAEVVPAASCLVFCPTKKNCENVASLLCKMQRKEMLSHRVAERAELSRALRAEGGGALAHSVRCGVAYHHAGLSSDERNLLETAFRSGVVSVLCCTSTLAAGVNLPARRVIVRAPLVGRQFMSLGAYRQMVGRAGRAGVTDAGESIVICGAREWESLRGVLSGGLPPARSVLGGALPALLLSGAALRLAQDRPGLRRMLRTTLLAVTHEHTVDIKQCCDDAIRSLLRSGALEVAPGGARAASEDVCYVHDDSQLMVTRLGRAAIKGCMDLNVAKQFLSDLEVASRSLVLMGSLHLLYLVTPHDASGIKPDYRHYHSLYDKLDDEGIQTAKVLGITEKTAIRMMTGKTITDVPEKVLCRFYIALMLHDLWKQLPFPDVADKYCISRGMVQAVMSSASSLAACAVRLCEELELWTFRALFGELAPRLQHCASPQLQQLMELPAVRKARAMQLMRAGYKRIEDLAKATPEDLVSSIDHLSRTAANHLISAARMMLIEKVENLRAEAEDVMDELKVK